MRCRASRGRVEPVPTVPWVTAQRTDGQPEIPDPATCRRRKHYRRWSTDVLRRRCHQLCLERWNDVDVDEERTQVERRWRWLSWTIDSVFASRDHRFITPTPTCMRTYENQICLIRTNWDPYKERIQMNESKHTHSRQTIKQAVWNTFCVISCLILLFLVFSVFSRCVSVYSIVLFCVAAIMA